MQILHNRAKAGQTKQHHLTLSYLHKSKSPELRIEDVDYFVVIQCICQLSFEGQKSQVVEVSCQH